MTNATKRLFVSESVELGQRWSVPFRAVWLAGDGAMLPFTRDQFVAIFVGYNESIWPIQVVAYLVGIFAIVILFRPVEAAGPARHRDSRTVLDLDRHRLSLAVFQ
jgi:hypothetical protein